MLTQVWFRNISPATCGLVPGVQWIRLQEQELLLVLLLTKRRRRLPALTFGGVLVERGPEAEFGSASAAGVGEPAGVQGPVFAQVGRGAKLLEAELALIRPLTRVHPVRL